MKSGRPTEMRLSSAPVERDNHRSMWQDRAVRRLPMDESIYSDGVARELLDSDTTSSARQRLSLTEPGGGIPGAAKRRPTPSPPSQYPRAHPCPPPLPPHR